MTLAAYQDAFARMVLSPALCLRARSDGEAALAGFDLDAAERSRLLHIARQPGMRITCILARANRLSSLVGALPLTCELLKPELGAIIDRYWDEKPMADLQSLPAGLVFAQHLVDYVPVMGLIKRVLDERPSHVAPAARFRNELEDYMSEHAATETLGAITSWARYAELFAYDENAEQFSLENPE